MRSSILPYLVSVAFCAAASPSVANVTISNATTANMACSGGVCAPTAADAVLNVQQLEAMLASENATVTTTGKNVQAMDIRVDARLTWSTANMLSLVAFHSILVNRRMTLTGGGSISLSAKDGKFACNDKGVLTFEKTSSHLTINGETYVLVDSVASLARAIAANPNGAFALRKSYDASRDGIYSSSPIATKFMGSFNGLGNTISNLTINDSKEYESVGLFAQPGLDSTIANVRLLNESAWGGDYSEVGGLAGSGSLGLASTVVVDSVSSGRVGGGNDSIVGGLVGAGGVTVRDSGSTAAVFGGQDSMTGGLVGQAGLISDSWSTGNVSGGNYAGGLAGELWGGRIHHSWASGQVSANGTGLAIAGGLVGDIFQGGSIELSYASGAVTCASNCGGLLGEADSYSPTLSKISQSYATGSVTTDSGWGGGLVGSSYHCQSCGIVDSYASGAVSGPVVGGLVGQNGLPLRYHQHSISSSYAIGAVHGIESAGGLIGLDWLNSNVRRSYWDMTTSGITNRSQGAGSIPNDPGIKGLNDKKLKSRLPRGFDSKIWAEDSNINNGYPYLIDNPPPK